MNCYKPVLLCFGLLLSLLPGPVIAATAGATAQGFTATGDWFVQLGGMGFYAPEYQGSDDYELSAFPLLEIRWQDRYFLSSRKGLGVYLLNAEDLKFALSLGYSFGRDEDDSSNLRGLGDIDSGVTANALFSWRLDDLTFATRYEQQISGEETGYQLHFNLAYALRIAEKTLLKPALTSVYSSDNYLADFFGVTPGQSASSGLPTYQASAGFKSFGANLLVTYALDRHWGLQAMTGYSRLIGDAADSPVVKDENQIFLGIGAAYRF